MAAEGVVQRITREDDPERCTGITGKGQCIFKRYPGTVFCIMHGKGAIDAEEKKKARVYQLTRFQAQFERHQDHDEIKTLQGEIALVRMALEMILNKCQDVDDIYMNINRINELVRTIEKLVMSCHKLELSSNTLIGKEKIFTIGDFILGLVGQYISDPDVLLALAEKMSSGLIDVIAGNQIIKEATPVSPVSLGSLEDGPDEEECGESESMG